MIEANRPYGTPLSNAPNTDQSLLASQLMPSVRTIAPRMHLERVRLDHPAFHQSVQRRMPGMSRLMSQSPQRDHPLSR